MALPTPPPSPSSSSPIHIAIIGAGIGGLALAIGLVKQNVPFTLYEAAPKFDAVGAGIGLGPNSLRAMELMDERFARMYDAIKVGNIDPSRKHEQIEILGAEEGFGEERGWRGGSVGHENFERSSAHRKALLEVMKELVPEGSVKFEKRVVDVKEVEGGKVRVRFLDGEEVFADAVVGCDGIKGLSRKWILGERFPEEVKSKYCHTYVYRGIAPMEDAKRILGDKAENAKWFMSPGAGWAMYPITGGKEANIVAFMQDKNEWVGEQSAREVSREQMESEFVKFDHRLRNLLPWVKPMRWPLFNHPDTPTYYNGRICMLGDAAHASSPSQAAGAGQGLEDAQLLSHLFGLVQGPQQIQTAIEIYDAIRRPRAQSVVQESRIVGDIYYLEYPGYGDDMQKITDEANVRLPAIWWYDLEKDVKKAETMFAEKCGAAGILGSEKPSSAKKVQMIEPAVVEKPEEKKEKRSKKFSKFSKFCTIL